nr:hypothetical protein [Tanacetum cinerariifolium]
VKVMKGKHRKVHMGIKVSTPGSAGAGSVLRRLRSAKITGKARIRTEGSLSDERGGKRVVSTPLNLEINKVIANFNSGDLNNNLMFAMGCSNNDSKDDWSLNVVVFNELCNGNDGSFIKSPLDSDPDIGFKCSPVAKSCGLKTSHEHTSVGDVGNIGVRIASFKDGIAIAETGILNEKGIAGFGTSNEHTSMEDVVNTGYVFSSSQDGIASYKGGTDFEFCKVKNFGGILKNPSGPLFSAHIGKNTTNNPFVSKSNDGGVWNKKVSNVLGSSILSNQFSADVDRFAEKLKQGSKDLALKMEYNGNRRISFSVEEFCVYNIPLELCNGNGIRKIMSGVGKPLLMDKMTRERCLKKAGKMDFARVLIEVSAEDDLPNILEIKYPPLGNRPSRIGKLEVKYQWRPPLCTHCKTFGHSTLSCKIRPRSDDEIAANTIKDAINVNSSGVTDSSAVLNEGFVTVGKRTSRLFLKIELLLLKVITIIMRNSQGSNASNRQMSNKNVGMKNSGGNSKQSNGVEWQKKNSKSNAGTGFVQGNVDKKPLYQYRNDPNFKPKVLVRGSGSNNNVNLVSDETIHIKNPFNVLCNEGDDSDDMGGINVNDELESKVWPELKEKVDILMKAVIYPSKQVKMDWSIHQMDYFYKNCYKFHLDPIIEDDEGDVESDVEGIAMDMKPEFDVDAVNNSEINTVACDDVSNAIPKIEIVKDRPFKFHNFLTTKDDFIPVVKRVWCNKVEIFAMFGLVSKLKLLKKPLRKLCFEQDPHNKSLRVEELRVLKEYKSALKDEESFLRQKSKVEWLNAGDRNSKYFNNVVKGKHNRYRISYVEDMEGNPFHGNSVGDQFVSHFKSVLGKCSKVFPIKDPSGLFLRKLSGPDALYMVRRVSDEEIKMALFDIDGNKAPGPDGFSFQFFKDSWNVVGGDVCKAVRDFFLNGKLLKEGSLNDLVDVNQSAFIPSRQISDNILLSQELMRNYHRNKGHAKCTFKIDIEKMYDSVEWDFLANCLKFFGFHDILVKWVMNCVSSASFTINVNGDHKDDLLLFCNGDSKSVSVMKKALSEFSESLWVRWVNAYRLKGRSFWDIPEKEGSCGAWKKFLKIMGFIKDYIFHKIGDGRNTSLWFDNWHPICPISNFISKRMIASSGLSMQSKVADVIKNDEWNWPVNLSNMFDALNVISPPCITKRKNDKVVWKSYNGWLLDFSVSNVWENIRTHGALVSWSNLDNMSHGDRNVRLLYILCGKVSDSHDHLFFDCNFPKSIWDNLKNMVRLDNAPNRWCDIVEFILNKPVNKSIWSILQRLVMGAAVYFIWHERNLRLFQNRHRSKEHLCYLIKDMVRLRVLSLSLKPFVQVYEAVDIWNFHVCNEIGSKRVKFAARNNSV